MTFEKTDISPREKGAEMSSVLRSVRKRKKGHTLGAVDVIDREEYAELEVDAKVGCCQVDEQAGRATPKILGSIPS